MTAGGTAAANSIKARADARARGGHGGRIEEVFTFTSSRSDLLVHNP